MIIGLVLKSMSCKIDASCLERRVQEYVQSWDERITKEVKFLGLLQPDLIVSDIVPWGEGVSRLVCISR